MATEKALKFLAGYGISEVGVTAVFLGKTQTGLGLGGRRQLAGPGFPNSRTARPPPPSCPPLIRQ